MLMTLIGQECPEKVTNIQQRNRKSFINRDIIIKNRRKIKSLFNIGVIYKVIEKVYKSAQIKRADFLSYHMNTQEKVYAPNS